MKKKNGKMCKTQRSRKTSEEYRQKVRSLIKDFMFTDGIVLITSESAVCNKMFWVKTIR